METQLKDKIDITTLVVTLLLITIGILSMYSATYDAAASIYFQRHVLWVITGTILMISVALVPFRTLQLYSYPLYGLSIMFLVGVLLLGKTIGGSKSWFGIGGFGLQPAEFAKAAAIIALAAYISQSHSRGRNLRRWKDLSPALMLILLPGALIIMQPDIGTAAVFVGMLFPILYWAGASKFLFLSLFAPGAAAIAALFGTTVFVIVVVAAFGILFLLRENRFISSIVFSLTVLVGVSVQFIYRTLQPYQQKRIDTFLDPESHPLGAGYNIIQAKIAIGSGGFFGKGYLQGTQTQLNFIPAQWTDFILCVPGEEFGFFGTSIILVLFALLLIRGVQIAFLVKNQYASMVAIGVTAVFAVHIVINIGMSMGLLPVIGIPLPFLSYGGSHLITNSLMVGLLLNMYRNRKEY